MDIQTNTPAIQAMASNSVPAFVFPTAGKIFAQAQEIYKTKFQALVLISFCSVAASALSGLVTGQGPVYLKSAIGSEKAVGIVLVVLIVLLVVYVSVWAFAATIRNISSPEANASAGKSFAESSRDVLPLIFTGLLVFLFVLGGLILLIVPGIILAFWYGQSVYIVITEGLTGKKAMDQSKRYVQGNIGQIFKKGFFIGLISFLAGFAIALVLGLIGNLINQSMLVKIGNIVFQIFWTPIVSIYAFLLFQYLRQSKTSITPAQ